MCSKDSDISGTGSVTLRWSECSAYTRTMVQHQYPNKQTTKQKPQLKQKKKPESYQGNKEIVEIKLKSNTNGIVEST
jgi:hypothetical protein